MKTMKRLMKSGVLALALVTVAGVAYATALHVRTIKSQANIEVGITSTLVAAANTQRHKIYIASLVTDGGPTIWVHYASLTGAVGTVDPATEDNGYPLEPGQIMNELGEGNEIYDGAFTAITDSATDPLLHVIEY